MNGVTGLFPGNYVEACRQDLPKDILQDNKTLCIFYPFSTAFSNTHSFSKLFYLLSNLLLEPNLSYAQINSEFFPNPNSRPFPRHQQRSICTYTKRRHLSGSVGKPNILVLPTTASVGEAQCEGKVSLRVFVHSAPAAACKLLFFCLAFWLIQRPLGVFFSQEEKELGRSS